VIAVPLIIVAMVGAFLYARYLLRKGLREVVKIFRQAHALGPESARTGEELGLDAPGTISIRSFWDSTPAAFSVLLRSGVVRVTDDGKFFLSEEALDASDQQRRIT